MSLGGLETGVESASEPSLTIDERDVKEIIESIKEAQHFDASSMAPLTPASVVSTRQCHPVQSLSGHRQLLLV